jgi:hypothetical protein
MALVGLPLRVIDTVKSPFAIVGRSATSVADTDSIGEGKCSRNVAVYCICIFFLKL